MMMKRIKKSNWMTLLAVVFAFNANAESTLVTTPKDLQKIVKSNAIVVVEFSADWCGPCKRMAPLYEEFTRLHAGKATFVVAKVDNWSEKSIEKLDIEGIPEIYIYKNGRKVFSPDSDQIEDDVNLYLHYGFNWFQNAMLENVANYLDKN